MSTEHFQIIGKKTRQEDAYYISSDRRLFVVCDGVGGRSKGQVASKTIVHNIYHQYETNGSTINNLDDIKLIIRNAIEALNTLVESENELGGTSTTLALLYIRKGKAYSAHIGDSRIIMITKSINRLWSTKDHSIVQELFDAGVLKSESEMLKHPYRNRITKAITANKTTIEDITFQMTPLFQEDDYFVVCTDGLLEHYTNTDLQEVFKHDSPKDAFKFLKKTCENKSKDNTTVILIKPINLY